jgi:tetratricopeptide (TPR) repeat protein
VEQPLLRVFIGSTWLDLQPEREAVEDALQRMGDSGFVGMEYFGSRDETTREVSLKEVDRSHVYVGIFAGRYGSGITEAEYRRARERNLPCFIYFKAESAITLDKYEQKQRQRTRLNKLKAELRQAHAIDEFDSPDDLAVKVATALHGWIMDEWLPQFRVQEIAAAPPVPLALHQLPPPPQDFTGRVAELTELADKIDQGGATISGLRGQGGVGKTALALKLAEQLKPHYPDAQFYLDLKGASEQQPLPVSDALSHVIRAYYPTAKLPEGEADLRALYLSVLNGQRALLLMDNARDAAQVAPLIPPAGCVLLVTSRQHFTLPGLYAKDLDTLPPEDARELLLRIAERIAEHADEIARLCGYLPLALRLAASALAERRNLSAADYVRRLTDAQRRLDLIEASLSLSYDLLTPELQKLWRALAVFPATFDDAAAAFVWEIEQDAAQDALGDLVNHSLLDFDESTARYSLHDLARLFADHRLSDEERLISQARHAAHYFYVLGKVDEFYLQGGDAIMQGLSLFDAEWTNIQAGQTWAASHADDDTAARLCARYPNAGIYVLNLRLHPREQVRWLEEALSAARKSNDRSIEGSALGNLGLAYADLGETRRAVEFHERDLAIRREIGDRRGEGNALNNLGIAYAALGETRRAIEFYEQALEIDRETGNRRGEGNVLVCLGSAYLYMRETRRAVEFYEQALEIYREIGDRRGEGDVLSGLGIAYKNLGETSRAVEFYEQQLIITREIGDRRGEGNALWNMSLALDALGERNRAIALAEDALRIYEQIEDPNAAKVRKKLAEWRGQIE